MVPILVTLTICFAAIAHRTLCFDSRNVIFTIISQSEPYLAKVANNLKKDIENQIVMVEGRLPTVLLTHEDIPIVGGWTVFRLFKPLLSKFNDSEVRWFIFLETHTEVRCAILLEVLQSHDLQPDTTWIGYPLINDNPMFFYQFDMFDLPAEDFLYPYFASGFAMRKTLMDNFDQRLEGDQRVGNIQKELMGDYSEVSRNPGYELARIFYGNECNPGPILVPEFKFCAFPDDSCATYPKQFETCGRLVSEKSILFAVKTFKPNHKDRVKVIKNTWGKNVTNLLFFSDFADPRVPIFSVGLPNDMNKGHCEKLIIILQRVLNWITELPYDIEWILISDDDTIFGVRRLCEVLSCYHGGDNIMMLGERFGFGYFYDYPEAERHDFITGGSGIVLSPGAARLIVENCRCDNEADDMMIGYCFRWHNIPVIHSPLFHQEVPDAYSWEELLRDGPVSFHHHGLQGPFHVYNRWLRDKGPHVTFNNNESNATIDNPYCRV